MFRIDDPSAVAQLPTPELALSEGYFTEGNPASGTPATLLRASWFNMIQEELRNIVVAGGLVPNKAVYNQVLSALTKFIQGGSMSYAVDTGAVNAYSVAYTPSITAPTPGLLLFFRAATANTGASTIGVNGLQPIALVGAAHQPLQGGEIVANGECMAIYNESISAFVLLESSGGALQVGAASGNMHAVQLQQLNASLNAISTSFSTALSQAIAGLQASLGFSPVQQGTGVGQSNTVVKLGMSTTNTAKLKATAGTTDLGNVALESWVSSLFVSPISASNQLLGSNTTLTASVSFTAPGPGILIAFGSRNNGTQASSASNAALYINGVQQMNDTTTLSTSHMGSVTTTGGAVTASYTAASATSFSATIMLIFIPNV